MNDLEKAIDILYGIYMNNDSIIRRDHFGVKGFSFNLFLIREFPDCRFSLMNGSWRLLKNEG